MPNWLTTRTKPEGKVTFGDRQKLRRADDLPSEEADLRPWFLFPGHRSKPEKVAQTFAERQRSRKVDAPDQDGSILSHRTKEKVTFSERQRRKRKGLEAGAPTFGEAEVLGNLDQIFDYSYEDAEDEDPELPSAAPPSQEGPSTAEGEKGDGKVKHSQKFRLPSSGKRLVSGAFAGAISRSAVAPLETIRTNLMVGSRGTSVTEVFRSIMRKEGWQGLFRGNGVNVLRIAPSKAIELYVFDTAKKLVAPFASGDAAPLRNFPISLVCGSAAGAASTLLTYPLEVVKTRITVEPGVYSNVLDAFVKIGSKNPRELYRGLVPSLIGIIPYAGTNYFTYDTLKSAYRKAAKKEQLGHLETLAIGSMAGAIACSVTFPLEVARKQMQMGSFGGRVVYKNTLDALMGIVREKGWGGLYLGLGPSTIKLMPAAGISFMCYEAMKRILIEDEKHH